MCAKVSKFLFLFKNRFLLCIKCLILKVDARNCGIYIKIKFDMLLNLFTIIVMNRKENEK